MSLVLLAAKKVELDQENDDEDGQHDCRREVPGMPEEDERQGRIDDHRDVDGDAIGGSEVGGGAEDEDEQDDAREEAAS